MRGIREGIDEHDHPDVDIGGDRLLDRPRAVGLTSCIVNHDHNHHDDRADHNIVRGESLF